MNDYKHRNLSLAVTVIYSLLLHAVALIAFLTIPLYTGESREPGAFLVHLESPAGGPDAGGNQHEALMEEESPAGGEPAPEKPAQAEAEEPVSVAPEAEEAAVMPEAPLIETEAREAEEPAHPEADRARPEVEHADDSGQEAEKSVRRPRMPLKKAPEIMEEETARERQVVAKRAEVAPEPAAEDTAPAVKPLEEKKAIEPEPVEDAHPIEALKPAEEQPQEEPSRIPEKPPEIEPPEPEPPEPLPPPKEPPAASEKAEPEEPPLEPATLVADKEEPAPEVSGYQEEQPIVAYEKPGWQEPEVVGAEPEEASPAPVDKEEPVEPVPLTEKQDIEPPAVTPLEAESPVSPEGEELEAEKLCEACDLVSRLYVNPLEIAVEPQVEERPAVEEDVEEKAVAEEIARGDELCEDCGPIASLYENPVAELMRPETEFAMAEGATFGTEGGMTSEKSVDMLCAGCLFLAMIEGNPADEIIYEGEPKGRVPDGFLSPMEEFCRKCRQPAAEAEVVKAVVWEISGDSAEIVGPPEAEDRKGLVLDVPQGDDFVAMEILRDTEAQKGIAMKVRASEGDDAGVEKGVVGMESDAEALDVAPGEPPGDAAEMGGVAEIFTPRVNRIPSREDYIAALDEAFRVEEEPEEVEIESPGVSLPLNIAKDISIRVSFSGEGGGLSFSLLMAPHPMALEGGRGADDLTGELEKLIINRGDGLRRIYSLSRAEKGLYRFNIVSSSGEEATIEVEVVLHGGLISEKKKDYEGIHVAKDTSYEIKFIMPEAVFWDDEDYFTGEIEGPSTLTRFNDETGLVWKEKKTER